MCAGDCKEMGESEGVDRLVERIHEFGCAFKVASVGVVSMVFLDGTCSMNGFSNVCMSCIQERKSLA